MPTPRPYSASSVSTPRAFGRRRLIGEMPTRLRDGGCARREMGVGDHGGVLLGGGCGVAAADRHAGHAGDGVRPDRGARRTARDRRGHGRPNGRGRQDARRGDPRGRAVRGRLADQASRAPARVCGSAATARGRAAVDDRHRRGARGGDLRSAQSDRGDRAGDTAGADGCRARRSGRDRAAAPVTHPPGTQRRERAQRRDLRTAAADRARRRGRRGQHREQPARDPHRRRADRLRDPRRRRGGAGRRRDRRDRLSPRPRQRLVAAGHSGRRRGPGLRDRGRAGRLGLHRGVRRRGDASARSSAGSPSRPHA